MISKAIAFVGAVIGVALSTAGAASADDILNGSYTRLILSSTTNLLRPAVVLLSPCGTGCTHWKLLDNPYPGFNMYLQGNRWVDTRNNGISHSFDKDTLVGITQGEMYGRPYSDTWVLTKNG
ncbi:hypothetical protein JN086_11285 [Mycolicibacterium austroafricanum]|uniref:Uncharacterized protein n=1 Tax=Mycolicibacterium austroafricanum TaxID=39687 RepID=A0ABT8HLE8_MYCAO|nr:hypothetical protein [Mycolicibacterium austroafricanum]MDN4521566.1 hypothetical protein [Mycolicibacterium austroafricanum]QRZ09395.1 hypothetical protein JN090_13350 [Mycolicibacterium austroafricanum]QZT70513.1 hypothetical protein JN086_11285 [Mycolicibacterium austroafricanum]